MSQEIIHQIAIEGPGYEGVYIVPVGETAIGRGDNNHLVFTHPLVSRKHATLVCAADSDRCLLTDLGSTHGTMLNHERIEANKPTALKSGDLVEIGAFRVVYERIVVGGAAETTTTTGTAETVAESPAISPALATQPPPDFPAPPRERPRARPVPQISASWETAVYVPIIRPPNQPPATKNGSGGGDGGHYEPPAGLSYDYSSYLEYLPDLYRSSYNSFIARFLALLESIMAPIEWNVDNFDLFLDPKTAPPAFFSWLGNWFNLDFDETWSIESQRQLLIEAHQLYQRRGTAWAMRRVLEIYTNKKVEIDDQNENLEPFTFFVKIHAVEKNINRNAIERLVNRYKPAHTSYSLLFVA